jgi:hypothetical protein
MSWSRVSSAGRRFVTVGEPLAPELSGPLPPATFNEAVKRQ